MNPQQIYVGDQLDLKKKKSLLYDCKITEPCIIMIGNNGFS